MKRLRYVMLENSTEVVFIPKDRIVKAKVKVTGISTDPYSLTVEYFTEDGSVKTETMFLQAGSLQEAKQKAIEKLQGVPLIDWTGVNIPSQREEKKLVEGKITTNVEDGAEIKYYTPTEEKTEEAVEEETLPRDEEHCYYKVGKKYLTRGGQVVEIISFGKDSSYPLNGRIENNKAFASWTYYGKYFITWDKPSTFDLVKEFQEPKDAKSEPEVDAPKKEECFFKVGRKYKTRGGGIAFITEYEENAVYSLRGKVIPAPGDVPRISWDSEGRFIAFTCSGSRESLYDLLKEEVQLCQA